MKKCIPVWCFQFYLVHLGTEVLNGTWEKRLLIDFGTSSYTQPRSIIGKYNFCWCIGTSLFSSVKFCTTLKNIRKKIKLWQINDFFLKFFSPKKSSKIANSIHGSSRQPKKKKDAQKISFLSQNWLLKIRKEISAYEQSPPWLHDKIEKKTIMWTLQGQWRLFGVGHWTHLKKGQTIDNLKKRTKNRFKKR